MKIKSILLSATIFAFVGCGTDGVGTEQQGAVGNYNNTFGSQNIAGIWNVFNASNNYIDRGTPSARFELDGYGKLYNVPADGAAKKEVATYSLISNQELDISTQNGKVVAQYLEADPANNSCFFVQSTFNRQPVKELWCKQASSSYQGGWQDQPTGQQDMRPQILAPVEGTEVQLKEYLYPEPTWKYGKKYSEDVYNYSIDAQQTTAFEGAVKKEFTRASDPQGNVIVSETLNGYEHKTDVITSTGITSYTKNNYGSYDIENYPSRVATNSEVATVNGDGITMTCVVKDFIPMQDLSSLVPSSVQNHLTNREGYTADMFTYSSIMHIFCGATNGITMDSYNVLGWGEVMTITKNPDNTSRYEIVDKKSIDYIY